MVDVGFNPRTRLPAPPPPSSRAWPPMHLPTNRPLPRAWPRTARLLPRQIVMHTPTFRYGLFADRIRRYTGAVRDHVGATIVWAAPPEPGGPCDGAWLSRLPIWSWSQR